MGHSPSIKVIVVGAGIVGSSVAYRLAQAGASVEIFDEQFVGAGTTGATFSWLNSFDKGPPAYHHLNMMGMSEHRALSKELSAQDCIHFGGGIMWQEDQGVPSDVPSSTSAPAERAYVDMTTQLTAGGLTAKIEACRRLGYSVEEITVAEALRLEPDLIIDETRVKTIYLAPNEGWVEARGLAHRLCSATVRRYGGTLRLGQAVIRVSSEGNTSAKVHLANGEVSRADVVINAAGPEAGRLASRSGSKITVERSLGIVFVFGSAPVQLQHVVHAPGVSLRPDSATRVMARVAGLDSTLTEGERWLPNDPRCTDVVAAASQAIPALTTVGVDSVRIGIRSIPEDDISIVGHDADIPNFYHIVTHSGATLGPILGRLAAVDILESQPAELAPFRPTRFVEMRRPQVEGGPVKGNA